MKGYAGKILRLDLTRSKGQHNPNSPNTGNGGAGTVWDRPSSSIW